LAYRDLQRPSGFAAFDFEPHAPGENTEISRRLSRHRSHRDHDKQVPTHPRSHAGDYATPPCPLAPHSRFEVLTRANRGG
jgi:hypothetical protein